MELFGSEFFLPPPVHSTPFQQLYWDQCDQMAKLFGQYFDIYDNENMPNSYKITQARFNSLPYTK